MGSVSGPWFDARGDMYVDDMCAEIVDKVTQQGYSEVMLLLSMTIRNPTPYYETQVQHYQVSDFEGVVDDRGIIYGPWLEGVGSSNQSTRFKGYHNWRDATRILQKYASDLAARARDRFADRMGR
jgi:hypothetical protein